MSGIRSTAAIPAEIMQRCTDGTDAAHQKRQEHRQKKAHPLPFRKPVAEQPQP